MPASPLAVPLLTSMLLALTACTVGPPYRRPPVEVPPAYKEAPPPGWKVAQPRDDVPRGKWWEIFQDPQLNALAAQVEVSNQNLAAAAARLRGARAAVRMARAALVPTVTGQVAVSGLRQSANRGTGGGEAASDPRANLRLPLDTSYTPDLWGRLEHDIEAHSANAQATAADLETLRLNTQAELAVTYFALRGLDGQKQLLGLTIAAFERALELTTNRYHQGVASRLEVEQARTQLEATRAQALEIGIQRAQFEHAIAVLIGKPPATLTIPPAPMEGEPPVIPTGVPSELLERRPDIAAAERRMAAANAQIGVAQAAFYPTVTLTAAIGVESATITNLFSWPSVLWSVGSSLAQAIFDGGRRQAVTEQALAAYEATVAAYRQTVLTAFQSVEDHLATLRILEETAHQQARVVQAAEAALLLALNRYRGGVTTYLEVVTAQNAALAARRTEIDLRTRRMTASVLLIRALGGLWDDLAT